MWSPLVLLFVVGVTLADYEHGWKIGNEYQYLVRSRTLTGLEITDNTGTPTDTSLQCTGILMKAVLTIQSITSDTLHAKITNCQYAQIHTKLPQGWESHISDQMLQYKNLPLFDQPFIVKMKHGVVRDLVIDKNVPTWELNIIKSIISQIQVDTQGENAKRNRDTQIPQDESPYAMFLAMEDMVGGKCEVLYDIQPLPDHVVRDNPQLVPMPELRNNGEHMIVTKMRNYNRCEQEARYQFVIDGSVNWGPEYKRNDKFLTKSAVSHITISGDLRNFVIQSSVTKSKMVIGANLEDMQQGTVMSKMNLTLVSMKEISEHLPMPRNRESTGNLVYTYNSAFSQHHRRLSRPSISPNSLPESESSSADASSDSWGSFGDAPRHFRDNNARSSMSASSTGSSEETQTFWQPHPKLEEAPENPLLPLFIGNKGKAISMSDSIDVVQRSRDLIQQISEELEDPNSMPDKETLEKFTILAQLIATMNRQQIIQTEGNLLSTVNQINSNDNEERKIENARTVLRDAVVQAGTGPALLTIIEWIENGKIKGWEAADAVARIPKTARTPTPEYVDKLFSLITKPEVQQELFLNTSAIISFAELVRHAQVANNSIEYSYPIDSFGRLISKRNDVVLRKYIPYFAEELKRAIRDGDSPRIQTYIAALGNIAHPKILSVFEPYLEGKQEISTFQRLLMVASLSRLAELNPRLTRSVLYKIYLNTWESHEIRCAAVYLLMAKTNPPLNMLQRMAQFTNFDTNRHVNSAVKSTIESAAKLKRPEWKDLADKARAARILLNPSKYSFRHSKYFMTDGDLKKRNTAYNILLSYIGSDETLLPNSGYLGIQTSHGGFISPTEDMVFMVSSFKSLMEILWQDKNSKESPVERIAKLLKIEAEVPKQVEGNFKMNSKYISRFLPFDNHTIEYMAKELMKEFYALNKGKRLNENTLKSYDAIISFPTETGLPLMCSVNLPTITKISGTMKLDTSTREMIKLLVDLRVVHAYKIQGRIGFVTPFDGQQFISGVDMNTQVFIPGKIELQGSEKERKVRMELRLPTQDPHVRMVHHSMVPYTSKQNIMSLQPVLLERTTQKLVMTDVTDIKLEDPTVPFSLKAEIDGLTKDEKKDTSWFSKLQLFMSKCYNTNMYRKIDVYMNPLKQPDNAIIIVATWDTMQLGLENADNVEKSWPTKAEAPVHYDSKSDSASRRKQFLKEVSKGVTSGNAFAVDVSLEMTHTIKNQWTLAVASSNVEEKCRTLLGWYVYVPKFDISYEVCAAGQSKETPVSPLDFEKAINGHPKYDFDMDIRFRESNEDKERITLWGQAKQSEDYKEALKENNVVKRCEEEMKEGNKALLACQRAINMASISNEMDLKMKLKSQWMRKALAKLQEDVQFLTNNKVSVSKTSRKEESKLVTMVVKFSPDLEKAEIDFTFGWTDMKIKGIQINDDDLKDAARLTFINNDDGNDDVKIEPTCVVDSNKVMTLDGKTYSSNLGKCSYVAMTTFPKHNFDKLNQLLHIPEDMQLNVIVRNLEDNKKEIKLTMGETEVLLVPDVSDSRPNVLVNGRKVKYSQEQSYQHQRDDGQIMFEIIELPGDVVRLTSQKYDIDAMYDGERIQMKPSLMYKRSVRGLCGNFDDLAENDFVTPKNCVLRKPEEFVATYALKDKCDSNTLRNAKMAEQSTCVQQEMRFSNVISALESGRPAIEGGNWGYHKKLNAKRCNKHHTMVVPRENEICFTMRPIPACAEGCTPVRVKTKKYQIHCMPRNEASLAMKRRVEQGAIPDLSQRTPSGVHETSVPVECAAA